MLMPLQNRMQRYGKEMLCLNEYLDTNSQEFILNLRESQHKPREGQLEKLQVYLCSFHTHMLSSDPKAFFFLLLIVPESKI